MRAIDSRGHVLRGQEVDWTRWCLDRSVQPLPLSGFSTVNPGGSTWSVNADKSVTLYAPAVAGPSLRCWVQTAPATPWTRVIHLKTLLVTANHRAGLLFRASGAGTLHSIHLDGAGAISIVRWTSPTVLSSTDLSASWTLGGDVWLAISDDGTNRNFSLSKAHGWDWYTIFSVARTTFLTANQWGVFVDGGDATYDGLATIFSMENSL